MSFTVRRVPSVNRLPLHSTRCKLIMFSSAAKKRVKASSMFLLFSSNFENIRDAVTLALRGARGRTVLLYSTQAVFTYARHTT